VLRIYSCTVEHHQLALVVLAALICLASAVTGMLLMRRALVVGDRRWIMGARGATGFGLWSTHFVALMGYRPDLSATYRLMPTIVSLGLAIMAVTAGLWLAARYRGRGASTLGALVVGCGVSAMHYVGVEALALPATIRFEPDLLALSVVLGVAPLEPALRLMRAQRRIELSCILLFLGVVMLHFTGMAAIVLIPSRMDDAGRTLLSAQTMSTLTGVAATLVILICLGALALARRTDALLRAGEHQFSILARNISDCALYMLTPDGRVANWNTAPNA
jgi:NO-binding membrane sensor protein with MHYT domain